MPKEIDGEYSGNLQDYIKSQYWISFYSNQLTDLIQMKKIETKHFNIPEREKESLNFTHQEAVEHEKYYWDRKRKCILSPARPTNVFLPFHLSNMMQQHYNSDDYFKKEKDRFVQRENRINELRKEEDND